MVECAVESSDWISVDKWESEQPEYVPTRVVLDHLAAVHGNKYKIFFVGGSDLIDSFAIPNVWSEEDLIRIIDHYGVLCIERDGKSGRDTVWSSELLYNHRAGIHFIPQYIANEISSTRIRQAIKRGLSTKYLLPDQVIAYIHQHSLYKS